MRVDQVIETVDGKYIVQSKFNPREMAMVVEAGLIHLLSKGVLPIEPIGAKEERLFRAFPPSELHAIKEPQVKSEDTDS